MTAKTFILGVGAQKAGTTWFFHYLASSPLVAPGAVKEYHIWDAVCLPLCRRFLVPAAQRHASPQNQLRWAMQNDPRAYFGYFDLLLRQPGKTITCDITPSYSGLPAAAYARIDQGFAALGVTVKAVFLMRDPVRRCFSYARMRHRAAAGDAPLDTDKLLSLALSEESEIRTRYDLTLQNLAAVFPADRLHVGLYEELQREDNVARLSAFCGVESRPAFAGERINEGSTSSALDPEAAATIARHYRAVYDWAAEHVPQARPLWSGYRHL